MAGKGGKQAVPGCNGTAFPTTGGLVQRQHAGFMK